MNRVAGMNKQIRNHAQCILYLSLREEMKLQIVQYNVFLRPTGLFRDGQVARASRIPRALQKLPGFTDLVVFCEVFDPLAREQLTREMSHVGFPFFTQVVGHQFDPPAHCTECGCFPRCRKGRLLATNGGVMVFSRIPFVHLQYFIFPNSEIHSTDSLAAKGFIHLSINKEGQRIHLFATHLEAWNSHISWTDRSYELLSICRQMSCVPPEEPCLLVGDLNCDYLGNRIETNIQLQLHEVSVPNMDRDSAPATFDSRKNDLVGRDGTHLPSRQWLDYGLFSLTHRTPRSCTLECHPIQSEEPILYNNGFLEKARTTFQLSDHFPVLCKYDF